MRFIRKNGRIIPIAKKTVLIGIAGYASYKAISGDSFKESIKEKMKDVAEEVTGVGIPLKLKKVLSR